MSSLVKARLGAFGLVCALWVVPATTRAVDAPIPPKHIVSDASGFLPPAQAQAIAGTLKAYELRTGRQFAVLIVPTLDDEVIETYATRVFDAWHLGRKPQDDGLLLLIAVREHRTRIEPGYGLEGDITDALSSRVVHNILRPALRAGKPGEGVARAMDALMAAADKSPIEGLLPERHHAGDADADIDPVTLGFWALVIVVLLLVVGPRAGLDILFLLLSGLGGGGGGRRGGDDSNGFSGGGGGSSGGGGASGDW